MKRLSCLLACLFTLSTINAETWTLHGCRDNYLWTSLYVPIDDPPGYNQIMLFEWDLAYDQAYPQWSDSGIATNVPPLAWSGYSDALSYSTDGPGWIGPITISGPGPNDYFGTIEVDAHLLAGEYWIDFDSATSASEQVLRVSTMRASDFGKWAWDGSINPSWVEPVAPLQKKHGKGHAK